MIETESPVPQLNAPIVLAPGLGGNARVSACGHTLRNYFPGVPDLLERAGNRVLVARVSPTDGVARRAADLKRFLDRELPGRRVHLIGHSMGGLDARYLTSRLGMEDRVLSVTTVGTPHRGTAFADWGWRRLSGLIVPFLRLVGIPHQAFIDLRTDTCARFNEDTPDVPGVRYASVAGACSRPWLGPEWWLPAGIVNRAEGANDGVVSVASARWGEHAEVWDGDHLNLVNWPNRRAKKHGVWEDRAPLYGRLVTRLAEAGF